MPRVGNRIFRPAEPEESDTASKDLPDVPFYGDDGELHTQAEFAAGEIAADFDVLM